MSVTGRNEIVAVCRLDGIEASTAEAIGPMAAGRLLAEKWDGEFPDNFATGIILHNLVSFVSYQVVTVAELVDLRVSEWPLLADLERQLFQEFALGADFNDSAGSGLHDHGLLIIKALHRVNLKLVGSVRLGAIRLCGVVVPDDALGQVNFDDVFPAVLGEQVEVGEKVQVVNRATEIVLPEHLVAVRRIDNSDGRLPSAPMTRRSSAESMVARVKSAARPRWWSS